MESIGSLKLTHSNNGTVRTEVSIPASLFGAQSIEEAGHILRDPRNVLSVQTEDPCSINGSDVTSDTDRLAAIYQMDCDSGARIEQIDVLLFDHVPQINEIEVQVITPATQKRFAIIRQCDNPIFRLQPRSD